MPEPAVRIRPFRPDDAFALAELFHETVHKIASLHYSPEQVLAWSPSIPEPSGFAERAKDGRIFLVAVDMADKPIAYGDLEADGHIDHLYCHPDFAGTGVMSKLYEELESAALRLGLSSLYVEASEPAQRFLERRGFVVQVRRDFHINGVPIHNYRLTKSLGT